MNKTYWACRFSIEHLFRGPELRTLHDPPTPSMCRLWTFTFKTEDPAAFDPALAMVRWRGLMTGCVAKAFWQGKQAVRVVEVGKRGRWHFHLVTGQWWRADDVRAFVESQGWGRINVKPIPCEQATYVAKYLNKQLKGLPAGLRRWGCIGFNGAKVAGISVKNTVDIVLDDGPDGFCWDVFEWRFVDTGTFRVQTRTPTNSDLRVKVMELSPKAQKEILALVVSGKKVVVMEYRGTKVRSMEVFSDELKRRVKRHIVEHTMEVNGNGEKVSQWLPDDGDPSTVQPPAKKGELVLVDFEKCSQQYGISAITIRSVAAMG